MLSWLVLLSVVAAPEVALLSSQGEVGELRFQPLGAAELTAPVARFSHGEGSAVLGALLPHSRVVVAAVATRAQGDLSYATVLLRIEGGKETRVLADGLSYGSRPLVTTEGRVFVARGKAGDERPGAMREDALSIEEVDPANGRRRLVYSAQGYLTFLAGVLSRELIVYEVMPTRARLIGIHADTLAVREIVPSMAPMARDFGVDAAKRRVVFTQSKDGRWCVEEVDLVTGVSRVLATGPEVTLLPTVWTDGRVLISGGPGTGLSTPEGSRVLPPQGPGFERVRIQREGTLVGLHEKPGDFPAVFASKDGKPLRVVTPINSRLDVAGLTP